MVTDYYENVYQRKLDYTGSSLKNKAISRNTKEFERYLAVTPTRQEVLLNDSETPINVSIQRSMQNLVGDRYEKNVLASLDDNLKIGDLLYWEDNYWIIISQERLVIPTHFKGKIRLCNHYLKWNHQGIIYQVPGHVITSRAFALEEGQKAGLTWEEGAMVVLGILPHNEQTATISRYHRFIIKERAWRVVSTDTLSVDNLIFIRLEEDQINLAKDDLDNQIADKYVPEESSQEVEGYIYAIEGESKIVWNQTESYLATRDEVSEGVDVIFSVSDPELVTLVTENTVNPAVLKGNSAGLTGEITLTCEFVATGQTLTKSIEILSLWGR